MKALRIHASGGPAELDEFNADLLALLQGTDTTEHQGGD
jgi:hypothetical protein